MNNIESTSGVLTLEQIANRFLQQSEDYGNNYAVLQKKIISKRKTLEKLEAALDELTYPAWKEWLLDPVINIIKEALPAWRGEVGKPMPGLPEKPITVYFERLKLKGDGDRFSDANSIYITFMPGDLSKGELLYCTHRTESSIPDNTPNQSVIMKPLETFSEAIEFLMRQARESDALIELQQTK